MCSSSMQQQQICQKFKMTLFGANNIEILIFCLLSTVDLCSSELKLIQSVFRHGDRYPLPFGATQAFYPLNPYANYSWYPNSDGGLTMEGKKRSYELGIVLRDRYGDWLEHRYSKKKVEFISAGNERATVTGSLVAAGLFAPNNSSQTWNPTLNWQPVAISSLRYPDNILFFGCFLCTKYAVLLEKTKLNDPEIIAYDARMKTLYKYVSRNIGKPANNRILYYFYMELLATMSAGLSVPKWAEEIYLNGSLEKATATEYAFSSWNDELKRMTGGVWLKNWFSLVDDYMSSKIANKSLNESEEKKQAFFYSGHDINVAGIMNTLGIFYPHVPNYASAINLELHENDKHQFYVKVVHRDSEGFLEYVIPDCDELLCPLDTFKNLFSKYRTFNATEDCGSLEMLPGGLKSL